MEGELWREQEVKEMKRGQLRAALGTFPRTHQLDTFPSHESLPDPQTFYLQLPASSADLLPPAGAQYGLHVLYGLFVSGQCAPEHSLPFSIPLQEEGHP